MDRAGSLRFVLLCSVLLLGACGELTPPDERSSSYSSSYVSAYTVRRGDTLYSIAWGAGVDVRELAAWNKISPPYTIYPGQRLSLAAPAWQRPASQRSQTPTASARSASPASSAPSNTAKSTTKSMPKAATTRGSLVKPRRSAAATPSSAAAKAPPPPAPYIENNRSSPNNLMSGWKWPTRGKLLNRFDASAGKKGIDIGGRVGQEIFTAAAGDVVYSGSGLLGYGNLVIIKHDETFLSAYGHNSQLLVKEGDKVTTGQKIAEMGVSPKEGAILHFEIRKEGKPVDPLVYLPK